MRFFCMKIIFEEIFILCIMQGERLHMELMFKTHKMFLSNKRFTARYQKTFAMYYFTGTISTIVDAKFAIQMLGCSFCVLYMVYQQLSLSLNLSLVLFLPLCLSLHLLLHLPLTLTYICLAFVECSSSLFIRLCSL